MRNLVGKAVCWWRGKHVERRVDMTLHVRGFGNYNRICMRCGRRRLAPQRKGKP